MDFFMEFLTTVRWKEKGKMCQYIITCNAWFETQTEYLNECFLNHL